MHLLLVAMPLLLEAEEVGEFSGKNGEKTSCHVKS